MIAQQNFFRKLVLASGICLALTACNSDKLSDNSMEYPINENLWLQYSSNETTFSLWSPKASEVKLHLYENGTDGNAYESHNLKLQEKGVWRLTLPGDLDGVYYTFQVNIDGKQLNETPGIYAKAVGVNGKRAMVLNFDRVTPQGFKESKGPTLESPNEAVIYELHVRDLSIHPASGIQHKGKFLGLVEPNTTTPTGVPTGLDHIKSLGVTHIHLLPSYDYGSVNEAKLEEPQFNWGYDPVNYNVPEGSYSTDPFKAEVRIKEFKEMVQAFHKNGLGVILDVVYNHTFNIDDNPFTLEYPGYYYRTWDDGAFSNASGCGNETASEREMARKFIIESCKHWLETYKLDGFRFDLMGIHDIETMNLLATELKKINPQVIIYGEGWTADDSPLPVEDRAIKVNTHKMPHISAFSDDIRDGIKGSVFLAEEAGFVNGAKGLEHTIRFGVVGSILHPQVDYDKVNYSNAPWALEPWQAVNYVSCHDNYTLFDKLVASTPNASAEQIERMHCLSNAIVLTAQGIPFLHAGVEFMRTKFGEHNSYNLPDAINQLDWERREKYNHIVEYYANLIQLRRAHKAFSLPTAELVNKHLTFLKTPESIVAFSLDNVGNYDSWKNVLVFYNATQKEYKHAINDSWNVATEGLTVMRNGSAIKQIQNEVTVEPLSMTILYQE
ncbi:MAG: type I pullulanase [Luteibaculaceae bacterium]